MRNVVIAAAMFASCGQVASAQEFLQLTPEQVGQIFCIGMLGNDMAPSRPS